MGGEGEGAPLGRASTRLAPFDPRPRGRRDLRRGDLVFVGAEATGLGAVVTELDGCGFSHVGVLWSPDELVMLSARTDRDGDVTRPDLGGVRADDLAALRGRGIFVAPLALPDEVRARGVARVEGWREDPAGPDPRSRSRFSYVKLIVASTALAALRRRHPLAPGPAERLWDASVRAATALAWGGGFPGFYCAELVAAMYGLEYEVDALWVRDGEPHPVGAPGPVARPPADAPDDDVDWGEVLRDLDEVVRGLAVAFDDIDLTAEQAAAVGGLVRTLLRVDPRLAWRLFRAAGELRGPAVPRHPQPVPPGPYAPPPFLGRAAGPLPSALVTPRLLLSTSVVRSVHPLDFA